MNSPPTNNPVGPPTNYAWHRAAAESEKCPCCDGPAGALDKCPYAADVREEEILCYCCEICSEECKADI